MLDVVLPPATPKDVLHGRAVLFAVFKLDAVVGEDRVNFIGNRPMRSEDAAAIILVAMPATISEDAAPVTGDVDDEVGSDVDDDAMTWELVDITIDGVLIEGANAADYGIPGMRKAPRPLTPSAFNKSDSDESHDIVVSYRANDGNVNSTIGKVSFTVTGANDAPAVGSVDAGTISEDAAPVTGDADDEVGSDVDGDPLTWALVDITIGRCVDRGRQSGRLRHHLE